LILLRVAIGWHFLYEGLEKVESTRKGGRSFSAEPYLRNSTGPLAPYFRNLVPDVDSREKFDLEKLKAVWAAEVERITGHYGFNEDQRKAAAAELRHEEEFAVAWFSDPEMSQKRTKYLDELREVEQLEQKPGALSYERERAASKRKDLDAVRRVLTADLDKHEEVLRKTVTELASDEQQAAAGPVPAAWTNLDLVNAMTMYGLVVMGVCLILGLFGPLAPLAGAVFLGQIYFSMPPWPGLPPNPMAEGHYFIVNKNLIEMLACLVLVFIPTSTWIGLDPLVFGWMFRRRDTAEVPPSSRPDSGTSKSTTTGRTAAVDVKPIPLSSPGLTERE
jgi:uncharacterized membrane protein YphA (DoxX/SURF4 family)